LKNFPDKTHRCCNLHPKLKSKRNVVTDKQKMQSLTEIGLVSTTAR